MAKHVSRRLRTEHLIPFNAGTSRDIENLLYSLNDDEYENGDALREMVRNMNAVDGITEQKAVPRTIHPYTPGLEKELRKNGFDETFVNRMKKIRDTFDGAKFDARISFPVRGRWEFGWEIPPTRDRLKLFFWLDLMVIRHLAEDGRLKQVRECTCGRWFFAYRPSEHYRFHSNACRDKHWRSTPEGKAKRAAFARRYRSGKKRYVKAHLKLHDRPEKRR
jgi:hypothetical protein